MKHVLFTLALLLIAAPASAQVGSVVSFHGYLCTGNNACAEHKEGYNWGRDNNVTDKAKCTGESQAVIEGCWAWVDFPEAAKPAAPKTFHGYTCTDDCSGHKAGYEWAAKKNIATPDNCKGKSNSFIQGCKAWVSENASTAE